MLHWLPIMFRMNFKIATLTVIGKMRNAESKMRNRKCGNGHGMVGKMRNAEKLKWGVNLANSISRF